MQTYISASQKDRQQIAEAVKKTEKEMTVNGIASFFSKTCIRRERADGVASAAYISGQRIYDGYYNKIHDYTSKSGVVFTEILTPEYVPERMTDREILWNEVEHVERNNKAQLA